MVNSTFIVFIYGTLLLKFETFYKVPFHLLGGFIVGAIGVNFIDLFFFASFSSTLNSSCISEPSYTSAPSPRADGSSLDNIEGGAFMLLGIGGRLFRMILQGKWRWITITHQNNMQN
jgi:hypothetical protein